MLPPLEWTYFRETLQLTWLPNLSIHREHARAASRQAMTSHGSLKMRNMLMQTIQVIRFRLFKRGFPILKLCVPLGLIRFAIASESFVTSGLKMPCLFLFWPGLLHTIASTVHSSNLPSVDRDLPPAAAVFID